MLRSGVELDSPVVARVASGAIVEGDEGAAHATRDGTERVCCRQPESGFASLKALERMPDNDSYDRCPVAAALSPPRKDTLVFYLALDDGRESPPCPVRVIAPRAWRDKRRLARENLPGRRVLVENGPPSPSSRRTFNGIFPAPLFYLQVLRQPKSAPRANRQQRNKQSERRTFKVERRPIIAQVKKLTYARNPEISAGTKS